MRKGDNGLGLDMTVVFHGGTGDAGDPRRPPAAAATRRAPRCVHTALADGRRVMAKPVPFPTQRPGRRR